MSEYRPPILGLSGNPPRIVEWQDGTVVYRGILGDLDPEALARWEAERERKEKLRQQSNVILLEDWRQND